MTINTDIEDSAYPSAATRAKIEALERAREAQHRKDALVEALTSFANGASYVEIAEFACDLSHQHRTLQQGVFGMFLQFAKVLASHDVDGNYDLRNEYSVKTSVKIMKLVDGCAGVPHV